MALIVFISYLSRISADTSGLIEKALSKQYKEKIEIDIFDTFEVFDYKIIAFTAYNNKKCSFAILKQREGDKYELIRVQKFDGFIDREIDVYVQYFDIYSDNQVSKNYMIILNMNEELATIETTIKVGEITRVDIDSMPSMVLIELPKDSYEMEYNFYDYFGNEIR